MKILRLVEIAAWGAAATLIALNQSRIVMGGLRVAYGGVENTPPSVLQHLAFASPLFPLVLGILAALRLRFERSGPLFDLARGRIVQDLRTGIVAGVVSIGITILCLRLLSQSMPLPPYNALPSSFHLFFATIGAVIPGLGEELYFRGMMIRIGRNLPKWLLVLTGAVFFSMWHVGWPVYLLHTFLLGLLWGWLFVRTNRLTPAVVAHVTANAGFGFLLLAGVPLFGGAPGAG